MVSDDLIKGALKIGAQVKASHPDKNQYVDAIVNKIQDCSQYTVGKLETFFGVSPLPLLLNPI